ncbi:hypothetical protein FQN53_008807 [Emmonsiellopsis sp. PD_33]|nr:hypothetical protein FQN53_008807 [Emmonsiellopsis sp. PD_33]
MAPRREKAEKEKEKEKGEDGEFSHFIRRGDDSELSARPYSAIDITANLHNKVSKAYTVKALKELHEKKEIEGRAAGKQIVYHAIQDPIDEATPDQLVSLDAEITALRDQIASTKTAEKTLRAELAAFSARVSTADLRRGVMELAKEREQLLGRLAPLRDGSVKGRKVSAEEQARVDGEWGRWRRVVAVRKRVCREVWERCSEVLPEGMKRRGGVWGSLGVEGGVWGGVVDRSEKDTTGQSEQE